LTIVEFGEGSRGGGLTIGFEGNHPNGTAPNDDAGVERERRGETLNPH
jgi:hypothetical protein